MNLEEQDLYLISAMVEQPGKMGHRARVWHFASEEEAIGSSFKLWQVDGWSVVSYDCIRCEHLFSPEIERLQKEIETAREDREKMHRRAQVAEGAATAALGIVNDWLPLCERHGLGRQDIMLRAIKRDLDKAVAKVCALKDKEVAG